jgi:hypothetical protein
MLPAPRIVTVGVKSNQRGALAEKLLSRVAIRKIRKFMNKNSSRTCGVFSAGLALAIQLLSVAPVAAQEFTDPVEDQGVYQGENATFTAEPRFGEMTFQWLRQWPDRYELLEGQTTSSLTLSNVSIADVGFYVCHVTKGEEVQLTRAASLTVHVRSSAGDTLGKKSSGKGMAMMMDYGGGTVTLFAPPVCVTGSQGSCPGAYAGYVSYTRTLAQGWGWAPSADTTNHVATDCVRTDTTVTYLGKFFDPGCAPQSVTVPHPTFSPKYRFSIFFPNNVPTTNAYPITLEGFDP